MKQTKAINLAKQLWYYHQLNQPLKKADCILVLGSNDLRVPEFAAQLFLDGWAPLLIMSGGLGNFTAGIWDEPEAIKFGKIARDMGVPSEQLLLEPNSTNSGENFAFTTQLLEEKGIDIQSVLLVQKPFMERRAYATAEQYWPEKSITVTSPPIAFHQYPTKHFSLDDLIHAMVGDFQRILIYPKFGFQTRQEVPQEVMHVYQELLNLDYTKHLVQAP